MKNGKLLFKKVFEPKGKTKHEEIYEIYEYEVSNGKWYRTESFTPAISFHTSKCWRSKEQAMRDYEHSINMEEWRSNGCIKGDIPKY